MKDYASDLIALNERIRAGTIFFDNFEGKNASEDLYRNLERFGLARSDVMILGVTPDGDDTVTGHLITRDGKTYTFDLDLTDPECSRVEGPQDTVGKRICHSESVIEAVTRWFKDT